MSCAIAFLIQAILAFLKSHNSAWTIPAGGVPLAKLRLNLYQEDRPLGNLGVGQTFLSILQLGTFWSKASDATIRLNLLKIIDLKD